MTRDLSLSIKIKPISQLSITEIDKLTHLTFSDSSHMSGVLCWAKANNILKSFDTNIPNLHGIVVLGFLGKELVGWCVAQRTELQNNNYTTSVFVESFHRRKGFGTHLYKILMSSLSKVSNLKIKRWALGATGTKFFETIENEQAMINNITDSVTTNKDNQ
jgi:Acetyltransferase (GNAT) family